MKKNLDYKSLYLNEYKNIPNYLFWGTLIFLGLGAIVTGAIFIFDSEEYMLGLGIIFGGSIVALGLAIWNRFISSVIISQKVVVADTLLSMNNVNSTVVLDCELPEL